MGISTEREGLNRGGKKERRRRGNLTTEFSEDTEVIDGGSRR